MINLDKGGKVSLDKEFPGLTCFMVGLGWYPPGYVPKRFRKEVHNVAQAEAPKKGGFFNTMGEMFQGKARLGDVVNAGIDSASSAVNSFFSDNDVTDDMRDYFKRKGIDVDASIIFLSNGKILDKSRDLVCFHHRQAYGDAVKHMGDNLTGVADDMDGDKEQIFIDLSKIPSYIDEAYVLINLYSANSRGLTFGKVNGAYVRLCDGKNINNELIYTNLSGEEYKKCEGMYAARLYRYNGEWRYHPEGQGARNASYIEDLLKKFQ